ncbi:MAG TPA: hypothetical protein RMH26_15980, partial [Polyangiaceae bacterium LLY-WYZ-15_(1-7)]|nr:hypothetical protein [Polyangiaceae bacterium LLY-WYZ-15_(1-7)]
MQLGVAAAERRPLVLVVAEGRWAHVLGETVRAAGGRLLRVAPEDAAQMVPKLRPDGIALHADPELTGRLAALVEAPLVTLGPEGELEGASLRALRSFVEGLRLAPRAVGSKLVDTRPPDERHDVFAGLRLLLVAEGPAQVDRVAHELRARGALVAVADASG